MEAFVEKDSGFWEQVGPRSKPACGVSFDQVFDALLPPSSSTGDRPGARWGCLES